MIINGEGVTVDYSVQIKPDFKIRTTPALKWVQLESGNFEAVDRGASEDVYQSDIRIYGTQAMVNEFITEFEANRSASIIPNVINLSGFNDTEKIFGCDVDYTGTIACTIIDMGRLEQKTWRGYGLKMRINALSVSFVVSAPAMPTLSRLAIGYKGDSSYTFNKIRNYDGSYTYIDHKADIGLFKGKFTFTEAEAIGYRRYVATERGNLIPLYQIGGVDYPFGTRSQGFYPYPVRILEWREEMWGLHHWIFDITFAEVA